MPVLKMKENADLISGDEIEFRTDGKQQMVMPVGMTYSRAFEILRLKQEEDEKVTSFSNIFTYRPLDGAHACAIVMKRRYGITVGKETVDMFGNEHPPQVRTIPIGPGGEKAQVPWGEVTIPQLPNTVLSLAAARHGDYGIVFVIQVQGPRKIKKEMNDFFADVEKELQVNSIYRGKAIAGTDEPVFIEDLAKFDSDKIVFADQVNATLDASLFSVLRHPGAIRQDGIPLKRAVLLYGPYGCIAGDAQIAVNRGGKGFSIRIEDLVRRYNGEDARVSWDPAIPTMVQREAADGTIRLTRIASAWCSGRKQTFTVVTESGRSVRATNEHPFLTKRGWLRLDELVVGDLVHVRGEKRGAGSQRARGKRAQYRARSIGTAHPYGKGSRSSGWHVPEHRLVVEASENGLDLGTYITTLRAGEVEGLKFIDPTEFHVHHKNENTLDNSLNNLEKMTQREHHVLHAEQYTHNVMIKIASERIVSITPYGEEMTYDLEVEGDPHNFLANGFVVHNTGKTSVGMMTAKEATASGWTFVMARPGRDDVGEVLQTARLYAPAVVWIEDIDTDTQSTDPKRISKLLDTFDGIGAKGGEIIMALTTNHVERIPPGMLRPGRLDYTIEIADLDRSATERLIRVVVSSEKLDELVDFDAVYQEMGGFLPAFVKATCDRAKSWAINRLGGSLDYTLTTVDLVGAAKSLHAQLALYASALETPSLPALDKVFREVVADAVDGSRFTDDDGDTMYHLARADSELASNGSR